MSPPTIAHQHPIHHIESYLNGASSLPIVVSTLASPIESAYTAGEVNDPHIDSTETLLWTLWNSIIDVAKDTPHNDTRSQSALVNLVAALKARPNPRRPQGREDLKNDWVWSDSWELWTDLVIFGASMREAWNDSPTNLGQCITVEEWTNVNAFVARLTAAGVRDFSLYAIWSMRETLETEITPEQLDKLLPASATWVLYAGKQLYESEEEWPKSPREGDPASGGPLWSGKRGFCRERWSSWKRGFESVAGREGVGEGARGIAKEAVGAMEAVERGT